MTTYSVFGLLNTTTGALTVAGVVEGAAFSVDTDPNEPGIQRWAASFEADSPTDAEELARDMAEGDSN